LKVIIFLICYNNLIVMKYKHCNKECAFIEIINKNILLKLLLKL